MGAQLRSTVQAFPGNQQPLMHDWTCIHAQLADTLDDGLRDHINHLDCRITEMVIR